MGNKKEPQSCPFLGVFLIGIALLLVTGNYYLRQERDEERQARLRRINTELGHLHRSASSSVATSTQ